MIGGLIPDDHHIARYCRPKQTEQGFPSVRAFHLRPADKDALSVNWLEHYTRNHKVVSADERELVIAQIRDHIQMDPSSNGRFAVLNVGQVKVAILEGGGSNPYVQSTPQPAKPAAGRRPARGPDPSHASVYGYSIDDNLDVAIQLLALINQDDVFAGKA
jgi:hypothetical protein